MDRTINDLSARLYSLNQEIKAAISESRFDEYEDLSGIKSDPRDPDQRQLVREYRDIFDKLETASRAIDYLQRPAADPERLHKNSQGKYETTKKVYSCGSPVEFLITEEIWPDGEPETVEEWRLGRIEHDGTDYYIFGYHDLPLEGLTVRQRED